jgi:hypothetical protein
VLDRIKGTRLASNDKENLEDNEGILKMIFFDGPRSSNLTKLRFQLEFLVERIDQSNFRIHFLSPTDS